MPLFRCAWCADIALTQLATEQGHQVLFDRLYRQLKASKCDAWEVDEEDEKDEDIFNQSSMGLRNRRHIWLNCERTLKAMESQHAPVRTQAGACSPEMSQLTTSKVVSISTASTSDVTLDVYMVPGLDKKGKLKEIVAHFAADGRMIGIEFQLSNEMLGRLFGNYGTTTSRITVEPGSVIIGTMISFGSLECERRGSGILGFRIVLEGQPLNPAHTLGVWNDQDVIQILHAESGMGIVGITGEFNVG